MWRWDGKSLTWIPKRYVGVVVFSKCNEWNINQLLFYWGFLQGIVFLVENELLRHTPEDIAQFLYKGEGLNKTAIGDYLGERCRIRSEPFLLLLSHPSKVRASASGPQG